MEGAGLRRWGVEAVAAVLAGVVFLACLGSLELWGKREQRLAAEVLDTVENGRWLVATIQGRPRLEKPPLPRWTTAALATLAGRCDEWIVRLPGALAALGTVVLTYLIGLRLGGRSLGLLAAIVLATTPLFIYEARQAGQDVPLGFFVTLAVYAAIRVLEGRTRDEIPSPLEGEAAVLSPRVRLREFSAETLDDNPSAPGPSDIQGGPKGRMRGRPASRLGEPPGLPHPRNPEASGSATPHPAFGRLLPQGEKATIASASSLISALLFHLALGLGFLCKGPVALAIVAAALAPWAIVTRQAARLARLALDPIGLAVFLALALGWPAAVWMADPGAAAVWMTEMGQKTGAMAIEHRERSGFLLQWPGLVLPWIVVGAVGATLPFRRGGDLRVRVGWSWSVGMAILLGFWAVAKPNYYVPCLPGFALLAADGWLWLDRRAAAGERRARLLLDVQWGSWTLLGVATAALTGRALGLPASPWSALTFAAAVVGGGLGAVATRRGRGAAAAVAALGATAVGVTVGYGVVAPRANPSRGHAAVALAIDRALPPEVDVLEFFHEIDEGLWFYLRDRRLAAVPGSQPRYNEAVDRFAAGPPSKRMAERKKLLADWLDRDARDGSFLLLRDQAYKDLADELTGATVPVIHERETSRNGLVLLRVSR